MTPGTFVSDEIKFSVLIMQQFEVTNHSILVLYFRSKCLIGE